MIQGVESGFPSFGDLNESRNHFVRRSHLLANCCTLSRRRRGTLQFAGTEPLPSSLVFLCCFVREKSYRLRRRRKSTWTLTNFQEETDSTKIIAGRRWQAAEFVTYVYRSANDHFYILILSFATIVDSCSKCKWIWKIQCWHNIFCIVHAASRILVRLVQPFVSWR